MTDQVKEVGKECRFAIHIPTRDPSIPDFHMVKEIVHYSDGTKKPNIILERDYERTFYVTQPAYRNHQQKKEYEEKEKLLRYKCTQSALPRAVARALDKGWMNNPQMRQLVDSPYLYGSDVSSTSVIKHDYFKKYPDTVSPYRVAYFDIETDVLQGTDDPIMATIVFEDKIYTSVTKDFVKGYANPTEKVMASIDKYLKPYVDKHQFKIEVEFVDGPVEVITKSIAKAHLWSPDFLAIWNLGFDIPRILETLEKYGVDAKDVFSDPKLAPELRFCKYKKGSVRKKTASGQHKPKAPSEQWHSLLCPAGFYVICAMASYRFIRQGAQELAYYSLDFVLNERLGIRKLKFKEADAYGDLEWHKFMQSRYPFEYIAYNQFDCIGMLELEVLTNDLSQALPIQADCTDFSQYNYQTKRFADKVHFYLDERDRSIGTIPPREEAEEVVTVEDDGEDDDEDDDEQKANGRDDDRDFQEKNQVLSLKDWIVTLPAHMSSLGKPLVAESATFLTMIRAFVYDSDAVSAYPSATAVANVSRETTVREIIDIEGIDETTFRRHNLNLLQGHVNALEYACVMHKLPTPQQALELFADMV